MQTYLIKIKPLEPYFFGGERNFGFGELKSKLSSNTYFIASETVPFQTAIFGTLRYCLLPHVNSNFSYDAKQRKENEEMIGANGFNIYDKEEKQRYGVIDDVSALFITNDKNEIFIKTPFDHANDDKENIYNPFEKYEEFETNIGKKQLPKYDLKKALQDSYMCVENKEIVKSDEIFDSQVKIGIKTNSDEDGFFKKEYKSLKNDYSFGIYASFSKEVICKNDIVFMGQGKSTFKVTFKKEENKLEEKINNIFAEHPKKECFAYALSDVYCSHEVYNCCDFAMTKLRDFRYLMLTKEAENNYKRYKKENMIKLIEAGSMFLINNNEKQKFQEIIKNKNCEKIGLNKIIYGGNK